MVASGVGAAAAGAAAGAGAVARDPLLDKALKDRQLNSAMAKAIADDQRHVPHEADVVVVRSDSKVVVSERHFVSGGVTEAERAEHGLNEANTRSHTEAKSVTRTRGPRRPDHVHLRAVRPVSDLQAPDARGSQRERGKIGYIWQGGFERFSRR